MKKKEFFGAAPAIPDGTRLPLSPAVAAGDFVFLSGQVPFDSEGRLVGNDVASQTRQVMANLEAALTVAGGTLDDIVKTTVWLARTEDFGAFNDAYGAFFPDAPPARTTVRSDLMGKGILVEIEATAQRQK